MKYSQTYKKLIAFLLSFILLCSTISTTVYADETDTTIEYVTIWTIYPTNYTGKTNNYLCSGSNPSGTLLELGTELYFDEEWTLKRYIIKDLPEDTYWITTNTGSDANYGFSTIHMGVGFPDVEPKSIVANIDYETTSIKLQKSSFLPSQGYPQFFCFYGTSEEMDTYLYYLEGLYDEIFTKAIAQRWKNYAVSGLRYVFVWLTKHGDIPGHFQDYFRLLKPLEFTVEDYIDISNNPYLNALAPESTVYKNILSQNFVTYFKREFSKNIIASDPAIQLRNWGWNIYYDATNTSNIILDEAGNNIGDFNIHGNSESDNIILPDLDGTPIPKDLPAWWPVIGLDYPRLMRLERAETEEEEDEVIYKEVPVPGTWVLDDSGDWTWDTTKLPEEVTITPEKEKLPSPIPTRAAEDTSITLETLPTPTSTIAPTLPPATLAPAPEIPSEEANPITVWSILIGLFGLLIIGSFGMILHKKSTANKKSKKSKK